MSHTPADISHDTALLKYQQHAGVKTLLMDIQNISRVPSKAALLHFTQKETCDTNPQAESVSIKRNIVFLL
jgi:hypothetical protein